MKSLTSLRFTVLLWIYCLLTTVAHQEVCAGALLTGAREEITRFLDSGDGTGKFHVQGWRWHTMSLVREANRLNQFARNSQNLPAISQAVDYVVGFNMKGLHKIERELFFPWARRQVKDPTVAKAFGALMDRLEDERQTIHELGVTLNKELAKASTSSKANQSDVCEIVASGSAKIAEHAKLMLDLEDSLLVPTIARVVSESEQKSFNNQVIRNLGIFDSRLHLVGMHEAVWALGDDKEKKLFEDTIPGIPQRLIPRWKRLLYEPQAGVLD